MNAVNIGISLGAVAAVAGLVWLIYRIGAGLKQSGRDAQKAEQDQDELAERIEADKKMQAARDDAAKKGGAKSALGRGEF